MRSQQALATRVLGVPGLGIQSFIETRWLHLAVLMLVAAAAMLFAPAVLAQAAAPESIGQILGATPAGDKSTEILRGAIGDFFVSPLSSIAGSSTLLGGMFLVFNGGIFLVSVLWGSWNIGRGIVSTAHEGQVLGSRLSAVWLPIRMVTGIAGVVPVFSGFNLAQVVYVTVTGIGIGLANMMFFAAINLTAQFNGIFNPSLTVPAAGVNFKQAAYGSFSMHICRLAKMEEEAAGGGVSEVNRIRFIPVAGALQSTKFGTSLNPDLCGSVSLWSGAAPVATSDSAFGFRVDSVEYETISSSITSGYAGAYPEFNDSISQLATTWWGQRRAAREGTSGDAGVPPLPTDQIELVARNYAAAVQGLATAAAAGKDAGAISESAREYMGRQGWAGLGAWYATFAEVGSTIADAMKSVEMRVVQQDEDLESSSMLYEAKLALSKAYDAGKSQSQKADDAGSEFAAIKTEVGDSLGIQPGGIGTVTGNWSLGQVIADKVIGFTVGGGTSGVSGVTLLNPIISMKNLGDWLMGFGQATLVAFKVAEVLPAGKVAEGLTGAVDKIPVIGTARKVLGNLTAGLGAMLQTAAIFAIGIGAIMAIYIPLIPFIAWMGALVQYAVVFIEGLVAMPLAALAHMEAEGDGLGQRTERGYIFMLNMLARPACMVIGFFLASTLMVLLGTFQANLFMGAVANAQGNSITGLITILGLLVVFLLLNWTLIQSLFNMIFLLPDQVIGMVGAGSSSEIGRDTEGKAYNTFLGFTRNLGGNTAAAVGSLGGVGRPSGASGGGGGGLPNPAAAGAAAGGAGSGPKPSGRGGRR